MLQQLLGRRAVVRRHGDADARAHEAGEAAFLHLDEHAFEEPLRGLDHLELVVDDGQHRDELVAAQPADEVVAPHAFLHAPRGFDQRLVADRVPERVVDRFETVEVDEQHADAAAAALRGREHVVEMVQRRGARGQLGERVDRTVAHRLDGFLGAQQQPRDRAGDGARDLVLRGAPACPTERDDVRRGRGEPRDVPRVVDALAHRDVRGFGRERVRRFVVDAVARCERDQRAVGSAHERDVGPGERERAGEEHVHQVGRGASRLDRGMK